MTTESFENVKNQIGFCGIWCGSCKGGNGAVMELAKMFRGFIQRDAIERYAPKFDFDEFMKGLNSISAMPSCPGCQKDGGNPTCTIRICARKKKVDNCSQCNLLSECKTFEELEKYYPKIKKDLMEIKGNNREELVEKWTCELAKKWPDCILLCESARKLKPQH
jgi:hypothetical protein